MTVWQRLFGSSSARAAWAMVLVLGCGHSQRPATVADVSAECRAEETDARTLRVMGQLEPEDVEAIKSMIDTISKYPVVTIRTDPPDFEKVLAKYGRGVVEVRTLARWSCDASSGETLFVVREGGAWRVINESYTWNIID